MYSFGNREDCSIVDEPFYAFYLKKTGFDHPGRNEILASMSDDPNDVKSNVIFSAYPKPLLFIKDMAHHLEQLDYSFLLQNKPVFLIRNIAKVIHSFAKVYEHPSLQDIAIKAEWEIYEYLLSKGQAPIILDTDRLLEDPKKQLTTVCELLEIPFTENMLSWTAGPRKEDGVWAPHWYSSVHQSTGFRQQKTTSTQLADHLLPLYQEALPYYEKMLEKSVS